MKKSISVLASLALMMMLSFGSVAATLSTDTSALIENLEGDPKKKKAKKKKEKKAKTPKVKKEKVKKEKSAAE